MPIHINTRNRIDIVKMITTNDNVRRIFIICEDGLVKSQILSGLIRCKIPNLRVQVISAKCLPTCKKINMVTELDNQETFNEIMDCYMTQPLNNMLDDIYYTGGKKISPRQYSNIWLNFFKRFNTAHNMFVLFKTDSATLNYITPLVCYSLFLSCNLPKRYDNIDFRSMKNIIESIFFDDSSR